MITNRHSIWIFPVSYRIWITLEAEAVAWRCYVKKVLNLA